MSGLKNRNLFLTILVARSLRSRCWLILFPSEGSIPGLQTATFSLCSHMVEKKERKQTLCVSYYKHTNAITGTPSSWPHLNLITFQWPYLQILSLWGLGFQHVNLGKSYTIHSMISPPHPFPVPPIGQTLLHRKDIKVGRTQSLLSGDS